MLVSVLWTFQCDFDTVSPFLVVVFIFRIWCVWNSYSCWRAWMTLFWGLALFNQQPLACQVIPMLATAMRNLQQTEGYSEAAIVQWLDTFFLSRIGTATRIPPAEAFCFWRRCLTATGIKIALRLRYQWMIQRFVNLCHECSYYVFRIEFNHGPLQCLDHWKVNFGRIGVVVLARNGGTGFGLDKSGPQPSSLQMPVNASNLVYKNAPLNHRPENHRCFFFFGGGILQRWFLRASPSY